MTRTARAVAVATLGIGLTVTAGQSLAQSGGEYPRGRRIEGTWFDRITPRDCQTGAEFPATPPGLVTFFKGGATISSTGGVPLSTGHGVWSQTGARSFLNRSQLLFTPPPTGAVAGIVTVTREITLSDDGAAFTASDVAELRGLDGTLLDTRCAGVVGTRAD